MSQTLIDTSKILWRPKNRDPIPIAKMDDDHIFHSIRFLNRYPQFKIKRIKQYTALMFEVESRKKEKERNKLYEQFKDKLWE